METLRAQTLPSMESKRRLGRAVRAARSRAALTVYQVAKGAGVSQQTIRWIENGTHSPRVETLERIAVAIGVSIVSLLDGEAA